MVGFGADQRVDSVANIIGLELLVWLCKDVSGPGQKFSIANLFRALPIGLLDYTPQNVE